MIIIVEYCSSPISSQGSRYSQRTNQILYRRGRWPVFLCRSVHWYGYRGRYGWNSQRKQIPSTSKGKEYSGSVI